MVDLKKYEELNKRIQEIKSNPDRKVIRKFVFIREEDNVDKVFAAKTRGQYRKATEKCSLYFCFNDQTFEKWTPQKDSNGKWVYPSSSKTTYLPDQEVPYDAFIPFVSNTSQGYIGKDIYEKMLRASECKDDCASELYVYPTRLGGDFHEIVSYKKSIFWDENC